MKPGNQRLSSQGANSSSTQVLKDERGLRMHFRTNSLFLLLRKRLFALTDKVPTGTDQRQERRMTP